MALKLECGYLKGFIGEHEYAAMASQVESAHALLASGKGPGNDFLGWVDLPTNYDKEEFARIKAAAERIKKNTDVFIVIGIGGSYLGARAAIEFLKSEHYNALKKDTPDIYFTGNSISSTALAELVEICEGKDISIITWSREVNFSLEAAAKLAQEGIEAEVLDLRTLVPLDWDAIVKTVSKTHNAIIVSEEVKRGSFAGELSAQIGEELFDELDAPVERVCGLNICSPFSPVLEDKNFPHPEDIVAAVKRVLNK